MTALHAMCNQVMYASQTSFSGILGANYQNTINFHLEPSPTMSDQDASNT